MILPPYARRSKSLDVLIPILHLKGISTGDFDEALAALVGRDAGGLSASTIARLKEVWADEHAHWQKRDLSAKQYVYLWVDGIHVQARLEDEAQCILVIIGATSEGKKELVGLADGIRESALSWKELLLDLKRRGLAFAPKLVIADGALGFCKAVSEVWSKAREQRCFRNGPPGVKSPVSASPSFGAPRERAPRNCAVASAALLLGFRRRRRRSLASVGGRHEGRHTMPSEETVSPSGWRGPSDDGQLATLRLH